MLRSDESKRWHGDFEQIQLAIFMPNLICFQNSVLYLFIYFIGANGFVLIIHPINITLHCYDVDSLAALLFIKFPKNVCRSAMLIHKP